MLWQLASFFFFFLVFFGVSGDKGLSVKLSRPKILQNKDSFFVYGSRFPQLGCSLHCTLDHWDLPGCHFISIQTIFPVNISICFPCECNRSFREVRMSLSKKRNKIISEIWISESFFLILHSGCWNKEGKKENSSVTSEFLITSTAHVRSLDFLGLPFLQESLVSAYSPLRWPFFHMLI